MNLNDMPHSGVLAAAVHVGLCCLGNRRSAADAATAGTANSLSSASAGIRDCRMRRPGASLNRREEMSLWSAVSHNTQVAKTQHEQAGARANGKGITDPERLANGHRHISL